MGKRRPDSQTKAAPTSTPAPTTPIKLDPMPDLQEELYRMEAELYGATAILDGLKEREIGIENPGLLSALRLIQSADSRIEPLIDSIEAALTRERVHSHG